MTEHASIPEVIIPAIRWHLTCFVQDGNDGLAFISPTGKPLLSADHR